MNTIQRLLALSEMGIRKTTQRDQRRRRVLVDERILTSSRGDSRGAAAPPSKTRTGGRPRRYAEAARVHRQPRVCSFVPTRPWTVLIWFLTGLAFVVAHATAFALMVRYAPVDMPIDLAPIQLTGPRALANWSSSLMLIFATVLSALIVQFRQHRIDDYRGEYRVWYYVIAGLVMASIDASVGGHQILFEAARYVAATYEIRRASLWINGLLSICVTGVSVRLLLEVRSSRGTVVIGLLSGAAYLCQLLLQNGIWPLPSADLEALAVGLARLVGHYLLVMSLVIYARYVVLDAQGLIGQTARKKKKKRGMRVAARAEGKAQPTSKNSQPSAGTKQESPSTHHGQAHAPAASQDRGSTAESAQSANSTRQGSLPQSGHPETGEEEGPATLKMSKSERRRMRKQKRRDRRAA